MMSTRSVLGRTAPRAFQSQCRVNPVQRRGLAAPASGGFQYETGEAAGVKLASRDLPGPVTTLTVVAKAGTRYQMLPGYSDALEKFAFKVRIPRRVQLDPQMLPTLTAIADHACFYP